MEANFIEVPFPRFVFRNVFDDGTLALLQDEMSAIHRANILFPPIKEETSLSTDGSLRNTSRSVWVDDIYVRERSNSVILSATESFIRGPMLAAVEESKHWFFTAQCRHSNFHNTLLNYYNQGSAYLAHRDLSPLSIIFTFFREPQVFTGGDLYFPQYKITEPAQNNSAVLFPGSVWHGIQQVEISTENASKGLSRFGIAIFVGER